MVPEAESLMLASISKDSSASARAFPRLFDVSVYGRDKCALAFGKARKRLCSGAYGHYNSIWWGLLWNKQRGKRHWA